MLQPFPHSIGISLILAFCVIINFSASQTTSKLRDLEENPPVLGKAKRNLALKTNRYLQAKPVSAELRQFIEKVKKHRDRRRLKRSQNIDENSVYVVQNGQLIPFNKIMKRDGKEPNQNDYTVIPLVVPVGGSGTNLNNKRIFDDNVLKQEPLKIRSRDTNEISTTENCSESSSYGNGTMEQPAASEEEKASVEEENRVLHKILDDVQGLMKWRNDGNAREGVICNLNGSWVSEAAGMRFDVTYTNSTRKKFRIKVFERIPPNEDGFMCDGNWSVFGEVPFQHSGLVIILAVHHKDKHIAAFIGECRTCEGTQSVSGTWLVGRTSKDCKDQKAASKVLSDVWRKEETHTLQKKHLLELGYTDVDNLINN